MHGAGQSLPAGLGRVRHEHAAEPGSRPSISPKCARAGAPGGLPMPSFDIVSKTDVHEIDNALAGLVREVAQRFDFKGSRCSIERNENELTVAADDELKLKQMQELLRVHITRRKLDPAALDMQKPEKAAGNSVRQIIRIKQGIDREIARTIVKAIKDSKLKVQAAVQGDELRVSGKNRDDLQNCIKLVRAMRIEQPLQYLNFRD